MAKKAQRSARGSGKGKGGGRKNLFKPGNPYRWPKGVSGNPGGGGIVRPMTERIRAFYEANPDQVDRLLETIHRGALGLSDLTHPQLQAYRELVRKLDREHLTEEGKDVRPVLEEIKLVMDPERPPERVQPRGERTELPPRMELEFEGEYPPEDQSPPPPKEPPLP